jgi:hypothetical protein
MKPEPPPPSGDGSTLVLFVLGLVALGGLAVAPGVVVTLAIFALPAWGITELIARRRRKRGLSTSLARKLALIATLTTAIPIVLALALFIAVWMICMANAPPSFH